MNLFQLQITGFHLRAGRKLPHSSTAHDSEQRFSSDKLYAAAVLEAASDNRSSRFIPEPDQVLSNLSQFKQRALAQAGNYLFFSSAVVTENNFISEQRLLI